MTLGLHEEVILRHLADECDGWVDAYDLRIKLEMDMRMFLQSLRTLEMAGYINANRDHAQHSVEISAAGIQRVKCRCDWGEGNWHCPVHHGDPPPPPPPVTSDHRTPHWPRETTGWLSRLGAWLAEGLRRK